MAWLSTSELVTVLKARPDGELAAEQADLEELARRARGGVATPTANRLAAWLELEADRKVYLLKDMPLAMAEIAVLRRQVAANTMPDRVASQLQELEKLRVEAEQMRAELAEQQRAQQQGPSLVKLERYRAETHPGTTHAAKAKFLEGLPLPWLELVQATENKQKLAELAQLGEHAAPHAAALTGLLRDGDLRVRSMAAKTLEKLSEKAAAGAARAAELLRDKDWQVRRNAASALEKLGDVCKAAGEALRNLCDHAGPHAPMAT